MTTKDLWGQLPDISDIKPPIAHLREQATLFGNKTANIISADVKISMEDYERILCQTLFLIAPALNNYRYAILKVKQEPGTIYPVTIEDCTTEEQYKCKTESEFLDNLEAILTSEPVRNIIKTLIAQSKATI